MSGLGLGLRSQNSGLGLGLDLAFEGLGLKCYGLILAGQVLSLALADVVQQWYINSKQHLTIRFNLL